MKNIFSDRTYRLGPKIRQREAAGGVGNNAPHGLNIDLFF